MEFNFTRSPWIIFGAGMIKTLNEQIRIYGTNVLLLTGSGSLKRSGYFEQIVNSLTDESIDHFTASIEGEPTPADINEICRKFSQHEIDVVAAIGGGSVLDAGKAVSAMIGKAEPVEDYLEDIGTRSHDGTKIPFVAVPTTAGTGSEATRNTVLSHVGKNGYKKSMRHSNFVPDIALIDPELTVSCPSLVTAACGMDAFTQLLESYVSTNASPLTDALALSGLKMIINNLIPIATTESENLMRRSAVSYAALLSGITLTNAGLGIVHGMAAPLGSYFKIPHGVVCGTLVGAATRMNIEILRKNRTSSGDSLQKYADIACLFSGNPGGDTDQQCDYLVQKIDEIINILDIPKLGKYGIQNGDIDKIVNETGLKFNPARLEQNDIIKIISDRL